MKYCEKLLELIKLFLKHLLVSFLGMIAYIFVQWDKLSFYEAFVIIASVATVVVLFVALHMKYINTSRRLDGRDR